MSVPAYLKKYPNLFKKMQVKNTVFRNRIFAAPTHHGFNVDANDFLNMQGVKTYGERAYNGAAVVTVSEGKIDYLNSTAHYGNVDCCSVAAPNTLMWLTDYVHTCGGLASIEFNHSGQFAEPRFNSNGIGPMGASHCIMPNGLECREMNEDDFELVAENIAHACLTAKKSGFDMVLLHYGHGWLFGGFLSPMFNHRTDKYGGTLENRLRFPRMVLERVRKAVGEDFLIELRLSGDEMTADGLKINDTIQIVKALEDLADMVQISCGTRLDPIARCMIGADHFMTPGHNAVFSKAVKEAGVKIPVGVVGSVSDPELAERILANGEADYIVMGRGLIADPEWVRKVKENHEEDIRPCIKCSRCGSMEKSVCSVNPLFGYVSLRESFKQPYVKKKIAVVGGGVAGMQAAIEAKARGHECVLYEQESELGGQLFYADYVWFKKEMKAYRDYLIRQTYKLGVTVCLNTKATPELIDQECFDGIIVAIGARPFVPPIPGVKGDNVITALDVFGKENMLPNDVVIIGGGLVGCELSLHLSRHGIRSTVVEMGKELAPDSVLQERIRTLDFMEKDSNITTYTEMKCVEVNPHGIIVENANGQVKQINTKKVIFASGMKANVEERDSFDGHAQDVVAIGDCEKVSNVHHAVYTGYSAALMM